MLGIWNKLFSCSHLNAKVIVFMHTSLKHLALPLQWECFMNVILIHKRNYIHEFMQILRQCFVFILFSTKSNLFLEFTFPLYGTTSIQYNLPISRHDIFCTNCILSCPPSSKIEIDISSHALFDQSYM